MSVCKLMVSDFLISSGRYNNGTECYDERDLTEGIYYAEWLLEMGLLTEPFYDFDLKKFINWCEVKRDQAVDINMK